MYYLNIVLYCVVIYWLVYVFVFVKGIGVGVYQIVQCLVVGMVVEVFINSVVVDKCEVIQGYNWNFYVGKLYFFLYYVKVMCIQL